MRDKASSEPPGWRITIHKVRAFLTNLSALIYALILDVWMRFGILPWYRKDDARRILRINKLARTWGTWTFRIVRIGLGVKVKIEGKIPESGRYLVMSNHQSSLDIPMLMGYIRTLDLKFVAMEELKYGKPAVSIALRNGGFAFVAKRSLGEDLAILQEYAKGLDRFNGSPAIFPEGIRTSDGTIGSFHLAGTETIRRICKLPILPMTIDGLWKARTIWELHLLVGSRITIRVSDPIPHEIVDKNPRETFRHVEETIRNNMREIRGNPPEEDTESVAAGLSG